MRGQATNQPTNIEDRATQLEAEFRNTQMLRELDQLAQMFSQAGSKEEREKVKIPTYKIKFN